MKVIYNSIVDAVQDAKEKADIAGRTIKCIEVTRSEAAEIRAETAMCMNDWFRTIPFKGYFGKLLDVDIYIVES